VKKLKSNLMSDYLLHVAVVYTLVLHNCGLISFTVIKN
jgi:hypothetical protein